MCTMCTILAYDIFLEQTFFVYFRANFLFVSLYILIFLHVSLQNMLQYHNNNHTLALLLFFLWEMQIMNLTFDNTHFGPAASQLFGNGLSTMKKLHTLELHRVRLDNIFFSSLAVSATGSQVWKHVTYSTS